MPMPQDAQMPMKPGAGTEDPTQMAKDRMAATNAPDQGKTPDPVIDALKTIQAALAAMGESNNPKAAGAMQAFRGLLEALGAGGGQQGPQPQAGPAPKAPQPAAAQPTAGTPAEIKGAPAQPVQRDQMAGRGARPM